MKVVDMDKAKGSLSDYARRNRRDAVVIIRHGKPVSALLPLQKGADLERLSLSMNPKFLRIIERSRKSLRRKGGLTLEQLQAKLARKGRSA